MLSGALTIQLVPSSNALLQLLDLLQVLQADMQLSTRSDDCWSSHILSAMEVLAHSHVFKHILLICEPVDLSCLVWNLRTRHLHNWEPFSSSHPRECNNKQWTYHQWCAPPTTRALVMRSPYALPKFIFCKKTRLSLLTRSPPTSQQPLGSGFGLGWGHASSLTGIVPRPAHS